MKKIFLIIVVLLVLAVNAFAAGEVSGGLYGYCKATYNVEGGWTCQIAQSPASCTSYYGPSCPAGYTLIQFYWAQPSTYACYKN